jgi:hypothetical protein
VQAAPAAPTAAPTTAGVPNTAVEPPTTLDGSLTALGIGLLLAAASGLLLLRGRRAR